MSYESRPWTDEEKKIRKEAKEQQRRNDVKEFLRTLNKIWNIYGAGIAKEHIIKYEKELEGLNGLAM